MELSVRNPSFYDGRFPNFRKPSQIGFFSLNHDRQYQDDSHQLKYICNPPKLTGLHMDLNVTYADAIRKEFGKKERIDILLTWILKHQDSVKKYFYSPETKRLNVDFVCFRGLLTQICATLYENQDDWCICATKYKSIIYLCAYDTQAHIHRRETATERDKLMSAWGYKFEQYLSSDSPTSKPDPSVPCNEKEEYCIVLKGRLNTHTVLFSAEVDGKDPKFLEKPEDPESTACYIELKTSRKITNERQNRNFCRYKLIKWWLQSFLVGIPKIICGFRNDEGIVQSLGIYHVQELPKMAENLWSPASTLQFGSQFLDFVKSCVKKDDPRVVYRFYWSPGNPISCEELKYPGEYQILPEWYTNNLKL